MKPIFILGMGAQKAGTTWLHQTLSQNDHINMGFIKEYHIWDYVFSDLGKFAKAPLLKPDRARYALRRMMQASPQIYVDYFKGLISSNTNVTGDITPSYSIIDRSGLEKISRYLEDAGFDIKIIFLLRDPIERLWSSVRMEKRDRIRRGQRLDDNFADLRAIEYTKTKVQIARSDYLSTVQNIEAVFAKSAIHYEFYENLFNKKSMERLSKFLGVSLKEADFARKANYSPTQLISTETTNILYNFLSPQYNFCNEKFPITRNLWLKFS